MKSNGIKYEKPELELFQIFESVITSSLDPNGSSNDDIVTWPTPTM